MTRRLQILLDDERYEVLEREAQRTGRSVAELVRDAVDTRFGPNLAQRRAAFAKILAVEPMPVEDWDVMKQELLDTYADPTA